MIEVPSAALAADLLAREVGLPRHRDQRSDPVHAGRRPHRRAGVWSLPAAQPWPAAAAARRSAAPPRKEGRSVSVCGEMASDPALLAVLHRSGPDRVQHDSACHPRRAASGRVGARGRAAGTGASAAIGRHDGALEDYLQREMGQTAGKTT